MLPGSLGGLQPGMEQPRKLGESLACRELGAGRWGQGRLHISHMGPQLREALGARRSCRGPQMERPWW